MSSGTSKLHMRACYFRLSLRVVTVEQYILAMVCTFVIVNMNLGGVIIESVDSICSDMTYTQYIQKNLSKSQKRYTYDQQDSSRHEKPSRKYHTRYSLNGQIVFLSSSSSFFRQASSTLPQSLTMVFARNSSILN